MKTKYNSLATTTRAVKGFPRREKLEKTNDEDIDYSDIPELDEQVFKNAKIVYPAKKERISINIKKDTLNWFRAQGRGYQSLIDAILEAYVKSQCERIARIDSSKSKTKSKVSRATSK